MTLLDIWGIWSVTLQGIHKTPGYSGPMKYWMFWACIIKSSQFAQEKLFLDWRPLKSTHPYVLLRNQYQNQRGNNSRHSLYWNFTPGIFLESWKILSGNFLLLELKNPGKFCPGRKLSWNFLKNNFTKKYFSWNLQFWNFPFLEFSIPGILSWNFLFLESYFTEFSCYQVKAEKANPTA